MTITSRRPSRGLRMAALLLALVLPLGCGPAEEGAAPTGQGSSELSKQRFDDAPAEKKP